MATTPPHSSPSTSPHSNPTTMTTPDQSPPPAQDPNTDNPHDSEDDIWATTPPRSPTIITTTHNPQSIHSNPPPNSDNEPLLSDLPAIRRRRMADGYRDGLSSGKAKVMQGGFDRGYPVGVAVALRAGRVLGVLEGVLAGLRRSSNGVVVGVGDEEARRREMVEQVERLLQEAREELGREKLLEGLDEEVVMSEGGVLGRVEGVLGRWEERVAFVQTQGSLAESANSSAVR